jgi:Prokaryotic E2 family C
MAMAFADYYGRNAVAASQVLAGYDDERIRSVLSNVRVGIAIGADAVDCAETAPLIDLLVRIVARFYPTLVLRGDSAFEAAATGVRDLARRINPNIEFADTPTIEVVIGTPVVPTDGVPRIFVGSRGWYALASATVPQRVGTSNNPFGPGAAACIAAANLFRAIFQPDAADLDEDASFSVIPLPPAGVGDVPTGAAFGEVPLIGNGAIGSAAAWALCRIPMNGVVHLVDHEAIDLGNLQRYVLAERGDEHAAKVDVLRRYFGGGIRAETHPQRFAAFVEASGSHWSRMLVALDSARDRRAAQASLPEWIANAWTQPGDLGVSTHDFLSGACVGCLYLPQHALPNEDALIAAALGVSDRLLDVRTLLHSGAGVPRPLLDAIALAGDIPIERLLPFIDRPVRMLYVEGFCGGAVIPLGRVGTPRQDVHVPLAHQSALAGVLLAAAAVAKAAGHEGAGTRIMRMDVLRRVPPFLTQAAAKDPRGICICQDSDYRDAYRRKYGPSAH